jgi:hypothetical protein
MPPQKGKRYRPRKSRELREMLLVERQKPELDTEHQKKLRSWYDGDNRMWTARKDRLAALERGDEPGGTGRPGAPAGESPCPTCGAPPPRHRAGPGGPEGVAEAERGRVSREAMAPSRRVAVNDTESVRPGCWGVQTDTCLASFVIEV